ncbi:SAM-dependent methyltransferase [Catenulispora sp. GAS73]|uniref:class I SAM-dependent methyltransferase n=1 Tax=Catenulispora sp. GAS73 TaxID=3156269 RepID=UPI003518B4F9
MTRFVEGFACDDDATLYGWVPGLESLAPYPQRDASMHEFLLGPYARVPTYYMAAARLVGGTILDLGCGDGRLAVRLAREGFAVVGVDKDAAMLHRLQARRERLPWAIRWRIAAHRADFTEDDLAGSGRFAMVLLAGATLAAVPPHSRAAFLKGLRSVLEPGGCLAFDHCEHDPVRLALEPVRKFNLTIDRRNGLSSLMSVTQRFADGIEQITYDSSVLGSDGKVRRQRSTTAKYVISDNELRSALSAAGWSVERNLRTSVATGVDNRFTVCWPRD